jgi:hypothetical protein
MIVGHLPHGSQTYFDFLGHNGVLQLLSSENIVERLVAWKFLESKH